MDRDIYELKRIRYAIEKNKTKNDSVDFPLEEPRRPSLILKIINSFFSFIIWSFIIIASILIYYFLFKL